jgi:hypothetical protein
LSNVSDSIGAGVPEDAINDKLWQEFEQWAFGSPRGTGDG